LRLLATGPIEILVDYDIRPAASGCAVDAAVSIRALDRRAGRLFARATGLLLDTGTLDHTLRRIAHEAERAPASSARGTTGARRRKPPHGAGGRPLPAPTPRGPTPRPGA
jgi:hypothetical protein